MFPNLNGYGAHLFIKKLGKKFNKDEFGVTAENKEKYISFNVKLAGVTNKDHEEYSAEVHRQLQIYGIKLK